MKRGGSCGKTAASASRHHIGKLVFRNLVPHVEHETAAGLEHAARLAITLDLVGKEHDAELARHHIERLILERQLQRIRLLPGQAAIGRLPCRGPVEHRLIEVGRDHARAFGKPRRDGARQHAGAGGGFQHVLRGGRGDPAGQVERVRLEDQRDQEAVVDFGDRPGKNLVSRRHRALRQPALPPWRMIPLNGRVTRGLSPAGQPWPAVAKAGVGWIYHRNISLLLGPSDLGRSSTDGQQSRNPRKTTTTSPAPMCSTPTARARATISTCSACR